MKKGNIKMKKINKKMNMQEVLELKGQEAAEVLMEAGMYCVDCIMAQMESLEEGCKAHGMTKKQIDEVVEKINKIK